MPLQAQQLVTLACQDAKCPGFTSQAGQFLNAALQDYCQLYDLDAALGNFQFSFNSATGNGPGPYNLPADYLRTQVKDGKDEFFYTINGVPYPLIQCTKAEYDWMVQTPGFQNFPYYYATDLSPVTAGQPAQLFVWPPASGSYPCTLRYYRLMPDIPTPETSAAVPWFGNTMILQRDIAGRLMGLTGDSRQEAYLGSDEERHPLGVGTLMRRYLKNVEDREGAVHTVGRDRRRWGRSFDLLKNTKTIGWALAAFMLYALALMAPDPVNACTAPCTKAQIASDISVNWPDNTSGAITPALLRSTVLELVNSYYDLNGTSSLSCAAHQWVAAIPSLSSITCSQPNFTDLAGTISSAQCPSCGAVNSVQYGIKCDGATDDGPAFITAFNALAGAPLVLPAGVCRIATNAFLNTFTTPGKLTTPGVKIIGQGRGVTKIDTTVANGYAISVNPAWAALHKSMFALTPGTAGALATNTYFVQTTVTDNLGNEINVSPARTTGVVTGATGSVALTLQPITSGYCYNIYIGTTSTPANYATVGGVDAICHAAGAVVITAVGSAHVVPTNKIAVWQEAQLSDLSITNSTAVANASGVLWFRVGYSIMSNVYMLGLTGDGLDIPNWTGDNDGSFVVTIDQSKFDTIAGWCINAAGNTLEFSNFTVSNSVFNLCGTSPNLWFSGASISAITNANPGVVTTVSPIGWTAGDQVWIQSVAGMSLSPGSFRACGSVTSTSFGLCDVNGNNVNTTALGAYSGSGVVELTFRPPQIQANGNGPTQSGAIAYTGLISNFFNNGFTQNKNTNIYMSEAGSNDNATFSGNDMENTYGVGLYVAAVLNLHWLNGECLSTNAVGPTTVCMLLGTGLNKGGAQNVTINGVKVRSDVGPASTGFMQISGAGGGLSYPQTVTANNVIWQAFTGTKYIGFGGNPLPFFWARLDGKTGATCTLKDSFNVTSCVRNATGTYTLTFSTPVLDANYTLMGSGTQIGVGGGAIAVNGAGDLTTTTAKFECFNFSSATQDCDILSVQGFGNPF